MMFKQKKYSDESAFNKRFTEKNNMVYTKIAKVYDSIIKILPIWNNWISQAIPHIEGERVLEVSFGTGLLLTQYADKYKTCGIDYNETMVATAKKNLKAKGIKADLIQGSVESLPYDDNSFDSIVNTMAFTGYPDGMKAMAELHRVLKPEGKLIIVDINYPENMNWLGVIHTKIWMLLGDIIRDMDPIFKAYDLVYTDQEIGGFGSVHLYITRKK